ncbi:hypothetical protein [Desulfitobacterium hafniense]|uniref:hypothetical protein n=1 Tax=Desulfitobacterium hafniense TaxID=49338 RepID=UPI00037C86F4|nr:hypothetical protein [Desulfitobacterium hafniense]
MSNDPKDTIVDWSKLLKTSQTTQNTSLNNSSSTNAPTMIIPLNEGTTSLIGHEMSSRDPLVGQENFSKDETKKKPD